MTLKDKFGLATIGGVNDDIKMFIN